MLASLGARVKCARACGADEFGNASGLVFGNRLRFSREGFACGKQCPQEPKPVPCCFEDYIIRLIIRPLCSLVRAGSRWASGTPSWSTGSSS